MVGWGEVKEGLHWGEVVHCLGSVSEALQGEARWLWYSGRKGQEGELEGYSGGGEDSGFKEGVWHWERQRELYTLTGL